MSLNPELVTVGAGGGLYTGWKSVQITASMRKAAREFQLVTTEMTSAIASTFAFPPGTPIQILANGTLMVDGYVNRYRPQGDANSHTVTVEGRSAAQDFIDCAAIHKPGYFKQKTPDQIAQELDLFGVGISAEVPLKPIPMHQIYQGETAHQSIERSLRDQRATMMGAERGIKITNASAAKRHGGGLIEGHNIKRFSGALTDDRRHSDHVVKGQARSGSGDTALRIQKEAKDSGVKRYRPKLIVQETDTNLERAQSRAQHEANRSKGFSVSATITTQGWRDDGGLVWQPNYLVYVHSPSLKISGDMLIEAVTWRQDSSAGSLSEIHVVNPAAYEGSGGSSGSDGGWS